MTINVFGGGNTGGPVFPVQRSVRLRSSASANFSRTFAANPTVRTKFHLHWIVKRGKLGSDQRMFSGYGAASGDSTWLIFNSSDNFVFNVGGSNGTLTSNAVFRDPSAWYILDLAFDSTQATAANRAKFYVNGVLQTWASGTVTLNGNPEVALANGNNKIGSNWDGSLFFDGYFSEFYFIDGQQLDATSFGSINSTTGVWQPIKYSGTYGTNGFYLNFQDNSGATATTIGKDSSGNGNNWTPNNISVTAGVTYDSMLDVPTLTSASNANFAVMNPLNQAGNAAPTNGNLTVSQAVNFAQVASSIGMSSGKWYYEHTITTVGGENSVGIGTSPLSTGVVGVGSAQYGYYSVNGNKYNNNTATAYGASFTTGDVIGVAYDADAGSLTFYKNGASQGVAFTGISGTLFALAATRTTGGQNSSNLNFGQRPFSYTPPTGFVSLNTYNLPAPTIPNGATQFAATTYTGVGSSLAISNTVNGKSFQPDLVWVKGRSGATDHALYDSVRGTTKQLESNTTTVETTEATGLTAFGTSGFTVGALAQMNTNTATYVGWQWKASNAAAVTNTSGSISSQVSANPSAGFSIVTFNAGAAGNKTVGHGLGVKPAMFIWKDRTTTGAWQVWHQSLSNQAQSYLILNTTAASVNDSRIWANTAPTSTVLSFESGYTFNINNNIVAYCFSEIAGYSKFGSYTGNGSTDGPFVYLGFRPRWILVKRTDSTGDWYIYDTSRNTFNLVTQVLFADLSDAESTYAAPNPVIDILSNGFKQRGTYPHNNASGGTYIYAAFAENSFNYSLAR
jgi:hypothetical protein